MNKQINLPSGVAQIIVSKGTVTAHMTAEMLDRGAGLGIGNDRLRFAPISGEDGDLPSPLTEFRPRFDATDLVSVTEPDGTQAEDLCKVYVNEMLDWALANRETVQIELCQTVQPFELKLNAGIRLPAHTTPLTFRAALAVHRASGRFILRMTDLDSGKTETRSFSFDRTRVGGTELDKYLLVDHKIPPAQTETEVTLSVAFDAFHGTDTDMPPYFFVADPHIARDVQEQDIDGTLVFDGPGGGNGEYIWARAPLPGFISPRSELVFLDGNTPYTVIPGRNIRVDMTEDYGHTLIMTASEAGSYRFHIDGEFAFNQHLGPDPIPVRMPSKFLTGTTRWLTVTDPAATEQLYANTILLPRLLTPLDVLKTESSAPFPGPLFPAAGHRYDAPARPAGRRAVARGSGPGVLLPGGGRRRL